MNQSTFLMDHESHYATITLNQPVPEALRDGLARVQDGRDIRALLIVAPNDLLADTRRTASTISAAEYNPLIRQLRELAFPIVCAVDGPATGVLASLALACDVVVAAHKASFSFCINDAAPLPAAGVSYLLPRTVGSARAMGILLLEDKVTADEAEHKGLIWKCVPDDRLLDEGRALAKYFAGRETRSLTAIKRTLRAALSNTFEAQLDLESAIQREISGTENKT